MSVVLSGRRSVNDKNQEGRFRTGFRGSDTWRYQKTSPLADSDRNALENELEDPRFQTEYWREQIELQLDIDKKAEQQALASRGLDFVTETYLPERLEEMGVP